MCFDLHKPRNGVNPPLIVVMDCPARSPRMVTLVVRFARVLLSLSSGPKLKAAGWPEVLVALRITVPPHRSRLGRYPHRGETNQWDRPVVTDGAASIHTAPNPSTSAAQIVTFALAYKNSIACFRGFIWISFSWFGLFGGLLKCFNCNEKKVSVRQTSTNRADCG